MKQIVNLAEGLIKHEIAKLWLRFKDLCWLRYHIIIVKN